MTATPGVPGDAGDRGDMHGVDVVVTEGQAFLDRNPEIPPAAKMIGGLTFGLMRAIAECPNCPGRFRVALDNDWDRLYCHGCKNLWEYTPEPATVAKPKGKRKAK